MRMDGVARNSISSNPRALTAHKLALVLSLSCSPGLPGLSYRKPYKKSKAGTANHTRASPAALLLDLWRQR